jgi:Ran-binding protein 1
MSDDAKPTPSADQTASSEPKLASDETKLATNPKSTEEEAKPATITDKASEAAAGVKDSVFSMFGGGAKKEKKADEDDAADEPSGSSKKKADDDDEVGEAFIYLQTDRLTHV